MMKLSDYVMRFLAERGVGTVFTVSGGGIMHLLDSLGTEPRLRYVCNYHEQASAICAEAHGRMTSRPSVVLCTVGPAAMNAISGMVGAWHDGIPMLVLTGQVRRDIIANYEQIRQFGPQEGNTVDMAAHVAKYARLIRDPLMIRYELEKAWHLAVSGRPGPVLLDFPLDVQAAQIDETQLVGFTPDPEPAGTEATLSAAADEIIALLGQSKRPVLVGGTGVRMAKAEGLFLELAERLGAPVVIPYSAKDLIPEEHPLNLGVIGTAGQRRANFTVQTADFLLGCAVGFSISKVGFNYRGFAPKAKKVLIDIDPGQLHRQAVVPDLAIAADIGRFLRILLAKLGSRRFDWSPKWLPACQDWRRRYPLILDSYRQRPDFVDGYVFMDQLSDRLHASDAVVTGNGFDAPACFQAFKVKPGQRCFTSNNWGSMGWGLPLAIGACVANGDQRTVCVSGDGSFTWNLQELLLLQQLRLPVKIFIFNNRGYMSIRTTQNTFFEGRQVAADARSGVADPDFRKIADAFGLTYHQIRTNAELDAGIAETLAGAGPSLCDVFIAPDQGVTPKASAFKRPDGVLESRPLEDMAPFLPREEIAANLGQFADES